MGGSRRVCGTQETQRGEKKKRVSSSSRDGAKDLCAGGAGPREEQEKED